MVVLDHGQPRRLNRSSLHSPFAVPIAREIAPHLLSHQAVPRVGKSHHQCPQGGGQEPVGSEHIHPNGSGRIRGDGESHVWHLPIFVFLLPLQACPSSWKQSRGLHLLPTAALRARVVQPNPQHGRSDQHRGQLMKCSWLSTSRMEQLAFCRR